MPFGLPLFYRTVISRYTAGLKPRGIPHPGKLTPLSGIAKELLPAGALRSNVVGTYGSPTNAPSLKCPCGGISSLAALVNHEGKRKFSSPT